MYELPHQEPDGFEPSGRAELRLQQHQLLPVPPDRGRGIAGGCASGALMNESDEGDTKAIWMGVAAAGFWRGRAGLRD